MSALRHLLAHIVDYAGLFPPASLSLDEVIRNYDHYSRSSDRWMLARIIVPASRLGEYSQTATQQIDVTTTPDDPWLVSALLPPPLADNFEQALTSIRQFNEAHESRDFKSVVDTVEVAPAEPEQIVPIVEQVPPEITIFIEIPHATPHAHFEQLAICRETRSNISAKIRTGGVQPQLIPTIDQVADFMLAAKAANCAFKATAGLHHPLRCEHALTYEVDAPRATMHGFWNVFLAACLLDQQKLARSELVELLMETDPESFRLGERSLGWRDFEIGTDALDRARGQFAISFGSCSFTEPLDDLRALDWLATAGGAAP